MKRLGTGAVVAAGAAAKAARLDEAAQAGLPVPDGVVVLDGTDPALDGTLTGLAAFFDGPVAVRSAFAAEDGSTSSLAGHFTSVLGVAPEPEALAAAIAEVRSSGRGHYRRDVLVMTMVDAQRAGVAFTEPGWADDLINHTTGLADGLLTGTEGGEQLVLARRSGPRLRSAPSWDQRLADLLRHVRSAFGDHGWDVEWADDGQVCWLVQLRPITAAPIRNERFTLANHREILPDPPSRFMTSLIVEASTRLRGPLGLIEGVAGSRRFIEVFDERPYLNLSMLSDRLRLLGLPTGLVAGSLGGADDQQHGPSPQRLLMAAPILVRLGLRQLSAVSGARAAAARFRREATAPERATGFGPAIEAAAAGYVALVDQMASLAAAMAIPVAVLSRLGLLEHHIARQRTAGTRILDDLAPLVELASANPGVLTAVAAGTVPEGDGASGFEGRWRTWLRDHGHRGSFESDLARPRYREDPTPILATIAVLAGDGRRRPAPRPAAGTDHGSRLGMAVTLSRPLWWLAAGPMAARESLRADAMRAFDRYRRDLRATASAAAADGRLPSSDALWHLSVDELRRLDDGTILTADEVRERTSQWERAAAIDVADLRDRFGPIGDAADGGPSQATTDAGGRLRGLALTTGRVRGRAWVLNEPSTTPPVGDGPVVLVARSVEAGWVPTFGLVDAVAVEIGGDLSHGSIILRELGLPAVTNVAGLTSKVATGDVIEVDAGAGAVEIDLNSRD